VLRPLLLALRLFEPDLEPLPPPSPIPQVELTTRMATVSVSRALERALERLREPSCRSLLQEFRDSTGVSLDERLAAREATLEAHAASVLFRSGNGQETCQNPFVAAFTRPGAQVVRICEAHWMRRQLRPGAWSEAVLIHELLHTLGLGENPPSSQFISQRVRASCGG
jgi:hypothetical protein